MDHQHFQHLTRTITTPSPINTQELRDLCLHEGADDVGFVEISRHAIDDQRGSILKEFPYAQTLISIACRNNRFNLRVPARSVANLEFHLTIERINTVSQKISMALVNAGYDCAIAGAAGFPMETDRWPEQMHLVSHKPIAIEAGLGQMGIHRNVIHPKFGNFIALGTIALNAKLTEYSKPIEYNPCLECKLCVAACPVGAIKPNGEFDFSACYTHNYREFLSGFSDWVEKITDSHSSKDYRKRVTDSETISMWQSLSYGANYKAAYCMAVCPAGEDVLAPYFKDKKTYLDTVVRPFQKKEETIYVMPNTDAETHVTKRFPHKKIRYVSNKVRPKSIYGFLNSLGLVFQREKSKNITLSIEFEFFGQERLSTIIHIKNQKLHILPSHSPARDLRIQVDSVSWLKFLAKEVGLLRLLLTRKLRFKGSLRHLQTFGRCFAI